MSDHFKSAFEESPEPKLILDYKSYQIIESNKAARKLFKLNSSLGKKLTIKTLLSPEQQNDFLYQLKKLKTKKSSSIGPFDFMAKKNNSINLNADLTQIKSNDKKQLLINFIQTNNSHQNIHRAKTYNNLFDTSQNPFIITDNSYRLIYGNKAAEKLFNKKAPLMIGKKLEEIYTIANNSSERNEIREELEKTGFWEGEVVIAVSRGRKKFNLLSISKITGGDNKPVGSIGVFKDITKLKKAEESVEETITKVQQVLDASPLGVHIYDLDETGNLIFVGYNKSANKILRLDHKKFINKKIEDAFPDLKSCGLVQVFKEITKNGTGFKNELLEYKDTLIEGAFDVSAIQIAPNRLATFFTDITEKKKALDDLEKNQLKYKTLFEFANDAIFLMNEDIFIDCNEKTLKMFGCKRKDIINKPPYEFSPAIQSDGSSSKERALEKISAALAGKPQFFEWKHKKLDGSLFDAEVSLSKVDLGSKTILQAIVRDITNRKNAQNKISILAHALKNIHESVCITDMLENIIFINNSFCNTYGYTLDEITGKHYSEFVSKNNPKKLVQCVLPSTLKGGWTGELYHTKKTGQEFPVSLSTSLIRDDAGKPIAFVSVSADISERKKAENDLQSAEQKLREIVEHSSNLFYSHTNKHVLTFVSPQSRYFLGCEPEEAKTRWTEFVTDNPVNKKGFEKSQLAIETGQTQIPYELELKTKDGRIIWVEVNEAPILENGKTVAVVGALIDITDRKMAAEKLIQSEENYRGIFDNASDAIYLQDIEGRFIEVSQGAVAMYGYDKDFFIGKTPEVLSAPGKNDLNKIMNQFQAALDGKPQRFEFWGKKKDGTIFPKLVRVQKGNYFGEDVLITFALDITERKQIEDELRKSEERFRSLIENMLEAALIIDLTGKILFANMSAAKIVGLKSPEEGIGKKVFDFLHPDFIAPVLQVLAKARNKEEPLMDEYMISTIDSEVKWVESLGSKISFKDNLAILLTLRDVTDRKNSEIELMEAKERAEEMSKIKSSFLANMSHELRTPLVGIMGFAELLKDELSDESYIGMADKILISGNRLMDTLNSLLDLSRIEANRIDLNFRTKNVAAMLKTQVELFKAYAQRKNLYLKTNIPNEGIYILADEQIFRQILNNLVNNALKYTDRGGVTITVDKINSDSIGFARIKVEDTGIGIPKESLHTIFHEFRQVSEGFNRHFEGTGLGLTITKKFVKIMSGTVSVDSNVGKGSVFTLLFPLVKTSEIREEILSSPQLNTDERNNGHDPANLSKILVVENDDASKEVTRLFLRNLYELDFAADGETAVNLAASNHYDIILMDINLGLGMSGLDAAIEIRNINGYSCVPIVALTAFAMRGDREEFLNAGCTHYLSKPFTKEKIVELLKEISKQNGKEVT
ncbi:MAG: PAS domain S-box protein [Ignavibacteria bacterium]|nr:PAS domain S-box protein [Ignavibacteria bacterium]